jgi:Domain of unknown function (DUF4915)
VIDSRTSGLEWLQGIPPSARAMGLIETADGFVALYAADSAGEHDSGMVAFDRTLRPTASAGLRQVRQAHSIIAHGGGYLVNSSAHDSLVSVRWSPSGGAPAEEVVWQFGQGGHDVHVNSVLEFDGHIYVSLLGPPESGRWQGCSNGSVWDTTSNEEVRGGLLTPHTLFRLGDQLCVLESPTGRVLSITSGAATELWRVPGFARGACLQAGSLYVGTSFVRVRPPGDHGPRRRSKIETSCAVHRIDLESGAVTTRDLSRDAREVYDLLPFDAVDCSLLLSPCGTCG